MATENNERRSPFSIVLALVSLILLIFLFGFYFENCLKKDLSAASNQDVLGVSTFNSSSSKGPVLNGESFTFVSTVTGDQNGVVNGTLLFELSGSGVINNSIQGPGTCLKLTNTTAVCNNVDVAANQTSYWTVPVSANSNCSTSSPASISLQARLVAPVGTFTSDSSVNCVASLNNPTATPAPSSGGGNPTPTAAPGSNTTNGNTGNTGNTGNNGSAGQTGSGGNQSGAGSNGSQTTGADNQSAAGSGVSVAGLACSKVSGLPLVFILFIIWLLATVYYFVFRNRN